MVERSRRIFSVFLCSHFFAKSVLIFSRLGTTLHVILTRCLTLCASSFLACSFFTNSALAKLNDFSSWSISFCLFSKSSVCARTLSDNSEKSPEEMQTTVRDPPPRDWMFRPNKNNSWFQVSDLPDEKMTEHKHFVDIFQYFTQKHLIKY